MKEKSKTLTNLHSLELGSACDVRAIRCGEVSHGVRGRLQPVHEPAGVCTSNSSRWDWKPSATALTCCFFHYMLSGNRFTSLWLTKLNSSALYLFLWPLRLNTKIRVFVRSSQRSSSPPPPAHPHTLLAHTAGLSVTGWGGGLWSSAVLGCLALHLPINARHKQSRQAL